MLTKLRPLPLLAVAAAIAAVLLVLVSLLPHDPYVRFQQLSHESIHYKRVKWIYERIHFDQRPIDIAFIGTSHTQSGVNSGIVEAALAAQGDQRRVVNFAVPHLGRDLQYLVARELLETRHLDTLVIEVQQVESRSPHPGFQRLATVTDIAAAPLFINTGVVDNLARLPMRQLELFAKTVRPGWFGIQPGFLPEQYEGLHFDDTYRLHGMQKPRTEVHPRAYFDKELTHIRADMAQKRSTSRYADLGPLNNAMYRYNDIYLEKLVELAERHSVKLVFMYLPFLGADPTPQRQAWFAQHGDVIVPLAVIGDEKLWLNADHLNFYGANTLSAWLGETLRRTRKPAE
jgi:hypothetical protein